MYREIFNELKLFPVRHFVLFIPRKQHSFLYFIVFASNQLLKKVVKIQKQYVCGSSKFTIDSSENADLPHRLLWFIERIPPVRCPTQPGGRDSVAPLKVTSGTQYLLLFPKPDSCVSEDFTISSWWLELTVMVTF